MKEHERAINLHYNSEATPEQIRVPGPMMGENVHQHAMIAMVSGRNHCHGNNHFR